jgi:uncharacterized RDD family membrane protein YckC
MTDPYQTPSAVVDDRHEASEGRLASRWQRLGGAFIDAIIGFAIGLPTMFMLGIFDYMRKGISPPFQVSLIGAVVGFTAFALIHGYFLKKSGQTIGKKVLGIKIVGIDNIQLSLPTILFKRYLPITAVSLIPILGGLLSLVDILFIFGAKKRCVHDYIAGSKVVTAS